MIEKILQKKKIIFICGDHKKEVAYFVNLVLKTNFSVFYTKEKPSIFDIFSLVKSDVVIFEDSEEKNKKNKEHFLSFSDTIFVVTESKKKIKIKKLFSQEEENRMAVLDFSIAKKIKKTKTKNIFTFGIERKNADFYITDINQKEGETNFKVNYKANSIPFWINRELKRKEIYAILPALCLAQMFNMNLAEISFGIKKELVSFT